VTPSAPAAKARKAERAEGLTPGAQGAQARRAERACGITNYGFCTTTAPCLTSIRASMVGWLGTFQPRPRK